MQPENVLCVIRPDGKEDLKLIDFGMTHIIEKGKDLKLACGTPEFVGMMTSQFLTSYSFTFIKLMSFFYLLILKINTDRLYISFNSTRSYHI